MKHCVECESLALCECNIAVVLPWWLLGAPCHWFSALEFAWTLSTLSDFCDWKLSGKANMLEG